MKMMMNILYANKALATYSLLESMLCNVFDAFYAVNSLKECYVYSWYNSLINNVIKWKQCAFTQCRSFVKARLVTNECLKQQVFNFKKLYVD